MKTKVIFTRYGDFSIIEGSDVISSSMDIYGEWAQKEIDLISHFIKVGDTVVDVGAFIGTHARAFSSLVGNQGRVIAFEPRDFSYSVLKVNADLSPHENIDAIPYALGAGKRKVLIPKLSDELNNLGASAIEPLKAEGSIGEKIEIRTLDDVGMVETVHFIKIDVEGMEFDVLQGAKRIIKNNSPIIFAESNSIEATLPILQWSRDCNYQVYGVISQAYNSKNYNHCDEDIYFDSQEVGVLLVPNKAIKEYKFILSELSLPKLKTADDLALLLLNKRQFADEVLSTTTAAKFLSLDYSSPRSRNLEVLLAKLQSENSRLTHEYDEKMGILQSENSRLTHEHDEKMGILQSENSRLMNDLDAMRDSTSWKITKPLRMIGKVLKQAKRAIALLADYRLRHPGLKGLIGLFRLIVEVYRIDGRRGLFSAMRDRQGRSRIEQTCRSSRPACLANTRVAKNEDLPDNVAVQLHVFHVDVLSEIRDYLLHIPIEFSLYVTTDSNEKVDDIKRVFKSIEHVGKLEIKITRNQGRDIAPMLIAFGQQLQNHALVLHLHTKKSPHNNELRGWRTYLMNCLLGSQLIVESIFTEFGKHESLGIFYPAPYLPIKPFMRLGGNSNYMYDLLCRSGRPSSDFDKIDKADFPAGSMFWFRGEVIKPLVDMNLTFDDFAVEAGQDDGTLAHAVERMFLYYASLLGFSSKAFLPSIMFSPTLPGALPLTKSAIESSQADASSVVIVFDHNLGGGTNFYSQDLINTIIGDGRSVFRVYYSQEYSQWIVQTVSEFDGMFYATRNVTHLFEILEKTSCKKIIVNSLYLMPSVNSVIEHIISLSQKVDASLDYKVHDFYAICPSQHLLNSESRYCNIPSDYSVCQKCLNVNVESLWKSTDSPTITNWRKPFTQLIDASSKVSVFDISSVDLLGTVFDIPHDKVVVKPHKIEGEYSVLPMEIYNGLHIGVLGTLTPAKGANEINSLACYMRNKGISIPITVVGRSHIDMEPQIELLGSYEKNELPSIILRSGINVIFISSIIPETFSYTISEAIAMGVPLVAFDTGAQGRRVSAYEKGIVVPLDSSPTTVLDALRKVYEINYQKEL